MKRVAILLAALFVLGGLSSLVFAQEPVSYGEQYRIQSWQDIWSDSDYWSKVWSYGYFRGKDWVYVRNNCPLQRPYVEKFWRGRYYVNHRIMRDRVYDSYQERYWTQSETERPAQRGYVYPATYGRTYLRNISDVWEIKMP